MNNTKETGTVGSTIEKNDNKLDDMTEKSKDKFNFEQIKEGKIFRKPLFKKREYGFRQRKNQYEILTEKNNITTTDLFDLNVENDILRKENQVLQETIQIMTVKENDLVESYEVEMMMVDTL